MRRKQFLVPGLLIIMTGLAIISPFGILGDMEGRQGIAGPRVAVYPDYCYTFGETGVSGTDNAHFNQPVAVAVNISDDTYVADQLNHRIQVLDKNGNYLYSIGVTGETGSDNMHFNRPAGVAVNATGYVYAVDMYNHRVQVFDNKGTYQYTICGNGVGTGNNQLNYPRGIAINSSGYIYVADNNNHRVQVFDNAGKYQYTLGVTGVSGTDNAHFNYPLGVSVNNTGYVYVADTNNHRIQVINNTGTYQSTLGVTGVSGIDNAHFNFPNGITVNSTGHVFVADTSNHRIQVIDRAGTYKYTIGTTGAAGNDNNHFNGPRGVVISNNGHIYVSDTDNHRVQVFGNPPPTGLSISINDGALDTSTIITVLTVSAINATEMCFSNNGTTYSDWEVYSTLKVWTLSGGPGPKTVYFKARRDLVESQPVFDTITYTLEPTTLSILINGGALETSDTSVTLTISAIGATEMCFSNNGTTYTDWEAYDTSREWTLDGGPGSKTVYFQVRNSTIEAGPATGIITYILQPEFLLIDINGGAIETGTTIVTLSLSATGATEMCFSNNGSTFTAWEPYGPSKLWNLVGTPGLNTVYFKVRNGTIEAVTQATDTITYILPPTGLAISINGGAAETAFFNVNLALTANNATEMCFSNNGTSYTSWEPYSLSKEWVLEGAPGLKTVYFKARNSTIEATTPKTGNITFVVPYSKYMYTIGFTGQFGLDNYHFSSPCGITVNATGHMYVVDTGNHRVQVFDKTGIYQYTIGETGVSGTDNVHFNAPIGIAVNATGYVYIADSSNHRVQVYNNSGRYQYTIGVTGSSGSDNAHFNRPYGIAVNTTGYVYIMDTFNHRVQVFNKTGKYQYTIGVAGISGVDNTHLNNPISAAINSSGCIYVADTSNHRVQVFNPAGTYLYTIGVSGVNGSDSSHFKLPGGIAVNATGCLYVSDTSNYRVQVFNQTGTYLYTIGVAGEFGSDNGHFNTPYGITMNATGHVFVVDTGNHRLQVFGMPPPSGLSITINGGATCTSTLLVTLTISAGNATEICFSNNGTTYSEWEAYKTSRMWSLEGGVGPKVVFLRVRNNYFEGGPVWNIISYTLPPTGLSISINNDAADTSSSIVILTLSATGATEMCISNDGMSWSLWEPIAPMKVWTLQSGLGPKAVYFRVRNGTIEATSPVFDTISFTLPPSGLTISINGGATETDNLIVTLTMSATDATEMCFSNDNKTWSSWEPYTTTKRWSLEGSAGPKNVYFLVRNGTIESVKPGHRTIIYIPSNSATNIGGVDMFFAVGLSMITAVIGLAIGAAIVKIKHKQPSASR